MKNPLLNRYNYVEGDELLGALIALTFAGSILAVIVAHSIYRGVTAEGNIVPACHESASIRCELVFGEES